MVDRLDVEKTSLEEELKYQKTLYQQLQQQQHLLLADKKSAGNT